MNRLKPEVDIILDVLQMVAKAQPKSAFVQSLLQQYQERGGLSKKQLQGLLGKASKLPHLPPNKLVTLEAIILRKHSKERSELPTNKPLYEKDAEIGNKIAEILATYPQHKGILFLKNKYDTNTPLSSADNTLLNRVHKLLTKN